MKHFFHALIGLALTFCVLTSCSGDDDIITGGYKFFEPCMTWDVSEAEIISFMNSKGGWIEQKDLEDQDELCFVDKETKADMRYDFKNGKLEETSVTYFGCPDKFDQMKADWAKALNLTWEEKDSSLGIYYSAHSDLKKCSIIAQSMSSNGLKYFYITFTADIFR